ncbi:MAG: hypothetical protein EOP49_33210 [Sphingobacteriales bacterium]|nr:MAG: hypothetical protein EOP49_33210 [Sphingobacteriales bacterium]
MEDNNKDANHLHKNEVDKRTTHLPGEDMERMPASDDDYRLPRELPEADDTNEGDGDEINDTENDDLIDEDTDISAEEIALLEEAERDTASDESRASDLLEDRDDDGDELNEGPDEDNAFDMGEDLDMPNDVNNPDIDEEDERF